MSHQIVTRFAPSPTGYLHVGGARTALFNWAYAKRTGGRFILRIEDTDVARSTEASMRLIIEDLQWLGLSWDEGPTGNGDSLGENGPYLQSQRTGIYQEYLQKLIALGRAYRCFKTPQQLKAERDLAAAEGRPQRYDRTESVSRSAADTEALLAEGKSFVWRFRMPEHDINVPDQVLGDVPIGTAELEDFVIVKSAEQGQGPTFHFANVVDDITMGVTDVLRAQEHLMNTHKHVALFEAFGCPAPRYAHMPLIFNPDNSKMSKRDKAKIARKQAQAVKLSSAAGVAPEQFAAFMAKKSDDPATAVAIAAELHLELPEIDVHEFRVSGYLPEVLLNYLALLGWSAKNDVERFSLQYLAENFDIKGIGRSNARFDRAKLLAFNAERLQGLSDDDFAATLKRHLEEFHPAELLHLGSHFPLFAKVYKARSRTLEEPLKLGHFFFAEDRAVEIAPKGWELLEKSGDAAPARLGEVTSLLEAVSPWTLETLREQIEAHLQQTGLQLGEIAGFLRVAASGSTATPPLYETLVILGQTATLSRLRQCLAALTERRQAVPQQA